MDYRIFIPPKELDVKYTPIELKDFDWRNGVVFRFPNWLGDAVMALPAIYALLKIMPDRCKSCAVVPSNLSLLFTQLGWFDEVISIGDGHSLPDREQLEKIKRFGGGVGMLFVNSIKSAYFFRRAGIKKIFGASNGLRNLLLTRAFKVKWHKKRGYETCHQSYKYLSMVKAFGADYEISLPDITISKSRILQKYMLHDILLVHPGAIYGEAKRWPVERFAAVADWWVDTVKGDVVVVGSIKEKKIASNLIKNVKNREKIYNLTGETSLVELMELIRESRIAICNDSGVMHLASLLKSKGVAIFGSTDPFATGPMMGQWVVMLKPQICSPCFSRECINKRKDYICLDSIAVDEVIEAILFLLNQHPIKN